VKVKLGGRNALAVERSSEIVLMAVEPCIPGEEIRLGLKLGLQSGLAALSGNPQKVTKYYLRIECWIVVQNGTVSFEPTMALCTTVVDIFPHVNYYTKYCM
jgi:hypothetical protein